MSSADGKCAVCGEPSSKRCQRCRAVWYCRRECQVSDWKSHKKRCEVVSADRAAADSHELHKREFDRIRTRYGLDSPEKAGEIAELLSNKGANDSVSAPDFARRFGMSDVEAVVFLGWIKVGVKFKEETLDNAKKAGMAG